MNKVFHSKQVEEKAKLHPGFLEKATQVIEEMAPKLLDAVREQSVPIEELAALITWDDVTRPFGLIKCAVFTKENYENAKEDGIDVPCPEDFDELMKEVQPSMLRILLISRSGNCISFFISDVGPMRTMSPGGDA